MKDLRKITASHLARKAIIYIRQSTLQQVSNNRESLGRQYDLYDVVKQMGFKEIVTIDEDLGKTGSGEIQRAGFEKLLTAVYLKEVGLIIGIEVSRLARCNAQMAHLVDLCGVFDTLIADHDGIYHPNDPNDRMILGFKGTISELELGVIKQRMHEGANRKARRGALWTNVPVGYLKEGKEKIVKDPNQRVQEIISKVFSKFDELGSIMKIRRWLKEEEIQFPKKKCQDGCEIIEWGKPTYSGLRCILQNPIYAGTYCRGRRKKRKEFIDGMWHIRVEWVAESGDWDNFRLDNHSAYITWQKHQEIQRKMMDNCKRGNETRGAVQDGVALLQGLVRCKGCGRRLAVRYSGNGGRVVSYYCQNSETDKCRMTVNGKKVETAVVGEVLTVVQPFALRASMEALAAFNEEHEERMRLVDLEIRQVDYEVKKARHRYEQVDPENRLVAANLEKSWNDALVQAGEVKQRREVLQESRRELSEDDRGRLLALAKDLPELWKAETTTSSMKKQIIRSVAEEVWVDRDEVSIQLDVHWKGGQVSSLLIEQRRAKRSGADEEKTDALIRQLAGQMPDDRIVSFLNRLKVRTGGDNLWTEKRLRSYRSKHKIAMFKPAQRQFVTMQEAAKELGITVDQVRSMVKRGVLTGAQVIPGAPWAIKLKDLHSENVQKAADSIKNGASETLKSPWEAYQKDLF